MKLSQTRWTTDTVSLGDPYPIVDRVVDAEDGTLIAQIEPSVPRLGVNTLAKAPELFCALRDMLVIIQNANLDMNAVHAGEHLEAWKLVKDLEAFEPLFDEDLDDSIAGYDLTTGEPVYR